MDLGGAAAFVDDGDAVGAGHGDVVAYAAAEVRAARVVLDCHVADGARLAVDGEDPVEVTGLVAARARRRSCLFIVVAYKIRVHQLMQPPNGSRRRRECGMVRYGLGPHQLVSEPDSRRLNFEQDQVLFFAAAVDARGGVARFAQRCAIGGGHGPTEP